MATSNLIQRTFGNLSLQSGDGTPNHTGPKGAMYIDNVGGTVWMNRSGGTAWDDQLHSIWRGGMFIIGATNGYESPAGWQLFGPTSGTYLGASFNDGIVLDDSPNDYRLVVQNTGKYAIFCSVTARGFSGQSGNLGISFSINGATPAVQDRIRRYINSGLNLNTSFSVFSIKNLNANDTITLAMDTGGNIFTPVNVAIGVIRI